MSVLTSIDTNTLAPQSGEIDDANRTGVVSGPATSVAKFAAYFKGIPYIAPFALATEIGASAVAGMARIFGYSRPSITKSPEPYKPTQVSSLALTNVPDTALKLTVDDKQELTIDPRISGIGGADPLSIKEIAKRESYLTSFNWATGAGAESFLWNCRVSPVLWNETTGPPVKYHFPACAFAALPFQYWRGTMKFRFQVVASTFHKGRLKIIWDPNYISNNTYLTFSEYNVNSLKIVDIAEEMDFTVEVGMGQEFSYLTHSDPGQDGLATMFGTSRYSSKMPGNGVLGVVVLNDLTSPNSVADNDITINVYISAGDDFEVASPDDYFSRFVLQPQSGDVDTDGMREMEMDKPLQTTGDILGLPPAYDSELNKVFMGEAITSFRPLLKRFSLWNTIPKTDNIPQAVAVRFPAFPYFRGNVSGAVDTTTLAAPYNYCNTLLLHWVRTAFQGSRGSIRYKLVPRGFQDRGDRIEVQRSVYQPGAPAYAVVRSGLNTYASDVTARRDIMANKVAATINNVPLYENPLFGARGLALTTNQINGALEVEVPYQSYFRFSPGKFENLTSQQLFDPAWDIHMYLNSEFVDSNSTTVDVYAAAGEDFQTYFFTGLPPMYYEANSPA
jgi:hypothetical protein